MDHGPQRGEGRLHKYNILGGGKLGQFGGGGGGGSWVSLGGGGGGGGGVELLGGGGGEASWKNICYSLVMRST